MGRYFFNTQPLRLEIKTKEAELQVEQKEWADVQARLDALESCEATKSMFQRFVNGELTIKELDAAIDQYLSRKQ